MSIPAYHKLFKQSKQWIRYSFLFSQFFLLACGSSQKSNQQNLENVDTKPVALNLPDSGIGKITFLTFEMSVLDSAKDNYQITLKNKQFVEGQLKAKSLLFGNAIESKYLYCEIESSSGEKSPIITVPNPLYSVYEYPADEKGALNKTTISQKKGELFLRFQWKPEDTYLHIYKPSLDLLTFKQIYYAKF